MESTSSYGATYRNVALACLLACTPWLSANATTPGGQAKSPSLPAVQEQASLDNALRAIVPAKYAIKVDASVPASTRLTWSTHGSWQTILDRALREQGLAAMRDMHKHTVFVGKASVVAEKVAHKEADIQAPEKKAFPYTIKAGLLLSVGMARYAKLYGWDLRWLAAEDYRLDAPLPIPAMSLKDGLDYVFTTYRAQGGLEKVDYKRHTPNTTVVVQAIEAQEAKR